MYIVFVRGERCQMDCIKVICLYLKKYVSDEQFETIFYDYVDDFQGCLPEDLYLYILSANFSRKEERIRLVTELCNYILKSHKSMYENVHDAYVECMVDSDAKDIITEILRERYIKREEVYIDCGKICTQFELIFSIKQSLEYPRFCGDNWDAIGI